MSGLENYLSAILGLLIGLLVIKEMRGIVCRYRANSQKDNAIRALLQRECEINYWIYTCLHREVTNLRDKTAAGETFTSSVARSFNEAIIIKHHSKGDFSGMTIPATRTAMMENLLLDAAINDGALFEALNAAYDAMAEMENVRQQLFYFIESQDKADLTVFSESALDELTESISALKTLHKVCTGKELSEWRVR